MSYNAGGIDITLDARLNALEANLRRGGVVVRQTTQQMADDAKKVDRAISGIGVGGSTPGGRPTPAATPPAQTARPPQPQPQPQAQQQNAQQTQNVQQGTFVGVTQALRQFFGRGGGGANVPPGGGFPPAQQPPRPGGGGIFGNGANIGGSGYIIQQVVRDAMQIGNLISEPVLKAVRGGIGTAEMEARANRDLDPKSRSKTLQEELDQANAELESFQRRKGGFFSRIYHSMLYPEGVFQTGDDLEKYAAEKERELRQYSQQGSAERIRARERVREAQYQEMVYEQAGGRYSINDLVMSSQQTATNTELLNMIVTRLPR